MAVLLSTWLLTFSLGLFHLVGPVPPELGVRDGSLAPCPSAAHCARADWPLDDPTAALALLRDDLAAQPRVELLEAEPTYLHTAVSSALFGFVDDLELHADPARGLLQARSVSRLGDSDLGVNARRLEELASRLGVAARG